MLTGIIAYVADSSSLKDRSTCVFLVDLVFGIALFLANTGFGYVLQMAGFNAAYLALFGLEISLLLFVILVVKETVTVSPDVKVKLFTLEHVIAGITVYTKRSASSGRRWKFILLLCIMILIQLLLSDMVTYHLLDRPLCFGATLIGFYTGLVYFVSAVGGTVCMVIFGSKLGDFGLLLVGCLSVILFQSLLPVYNNETEIFLGMSFLFNCMKLL